MIDNGGCLRDEVCYGPCGGRRARWEANVASHEEDQVALAALVEVKTTRAVEVPEWKEHMVDCRVDRGDAACNL